MFCVLQSLLVYKSRASSIIPIINISEFYSLNHEIRKQIAAQIGDACRNVGFFVVTGYRIDTAVIDSIWESTKVFFDQTDDYKRSYMSTNETHYPFGYVPLGGEILKLGKQAEKHVNKMIPGKHYEISVDDDDIADTKEDNEIESETTVYLPDLKESFSIGPSNQKSGFHERIFPQTPHSFKSTYEAYYDDLTSLANIILEAFAVALELPTDNYFEQFMDHHGSCIRSLNYPALPKSYHSNPNQYRASAHTDYGAITILKTDGPGLQVARDIEGLDEPSLQWIDVPYIEDGFIVNLGDLMKRWTNDLWLSTLHRVIIPETELQQSLEIMNDVCTSSSSSSPDQICTMTDSSDGSEGSRGRSRGLTARRQSIAFFCNINPDALVSTLPSSIIEAATARDSVSKYEQVSAGEFLLQKHLAAAAAARHT